MIKKLILISIVFVILTAIFTYPFIFRMNSGIAGWHSTDEPFAALWNSWWCKYAFEHNLKDTYYSVIAAPFGFDTGGRTASPAWDFVYKWLSILTNHFFPFNIQIFLSFVLSGVSMYCLVFYLTGKNTPSLFSAIIYAFCPYHFARAWQHLGLAQIQWMPLYLLTLFHLKERLALKNLFLCIIAISLVNSFELHYAIFMYIGTFLFLVYYFLFYKKIELKLLAALFTVMAIGAILVLSTSALGSLKDMLFKRNAIQPSVWSLVRPFGDLFSQSARPLSYFLPATAHPVFGGFTEHFIGSSLYGTSFTEHTLYLGWASLILAFIAFKRWERNRKLPITDYRLPISDKQNFYIGFFLLLAITAWLFSQPPWWNVFGLKLYMPSFLMYKILPIIRAYCRFGILVMLAVAVLAGFGLGFILDKFRLQKTKTAISALFCSLVLFEFWNYPPFKVIDLSMVPEAYYWLKEQPKDFVVAEYPLDTNGANLMYMFYQTTHEKKIINGTLPGVYANSVTRTIAKLSDSNTPGILKWMGVKYVLIHRQDYLDSELTEDRDELQKVPQNPALKFVRNFLAQECPGKDTMCVRKTGPVDVYEVVAQPIEPKVE